MKFQYDIEHKYETCNCGVEFAARLHATVLFADLFSVSSSFFLLLASSSRLCNSAIFSLSDPSWASFNILFSCWSRIKCSLWKHIGQKRALTSNDADHTQLKQPILVVIHLYSLNLQNIYVNMSLIHHITKANTLLHASQLSPSSVGLFSRLI